MSERERGTIKWFNIQKGYGFIARKDDKDVFFHELEIQSRGSPVLHKGQVVEFQVEQTPKGPKATDVTVPWYT